MFKKLKAFTLAEALIVITIIGVIAALTLPAYKSNYLAKTYATGLKKNFYVLSTALEQYELDNFRKIKGPDLTTFIEKIYPYLNVQKICPAKGEEGEGLCPLATDYEPYSEIEPYDESWSEILYKNGSIVLNDGSLIMLGSNPYPGNGGLNWGYIFVDVNGYGKGPNRMGEDLQSLILKNNDGTLIPNGSPETVNFYVDRSSYCTKNTNSYTKKHNGMSCAYNILRNER